MPTTTFLEYWHRHHAEYQAILFDLDGTLISGGKALPGAAELLQRLQADHTPYACLTNDSCHSVSEKQRLLEQAGLPVTPAEIVSCGCALSDLAARHHWQGELFFQLGRLGTPSYAELAGLRVTSDPENIDACTGILHGEGRYDWYTDIQATINALRRCPDRPYIVANPDSYWPSGRRGALGIGSGGQARFIQGILREMGHELNLTYLGKPYRPIFDYTVSLLQQRYPTHPTFDPSRIIMLGDSLRSDIQGANACGMASGLLLTGITTRLQAEQAEPPCRPTLVFPGIA